MQELLAVEPFGSATVNAARDREDRVSVCASTPDHRGELAAHRQFAADDEERQQRRFDVEAPVESVGAADYACDEH
jgi:hypothetical protein